jgi:methylthioribose-1-phosphate isomerase
VGVAEISIEARDAAAVTDVAGLHGGRRLVVRTAAIDAPAQNPAFELTPARLGTAHDAAHGICATSGTGLLRLFLRLATT